MDKTKWREAGVTTFDVEEIATTLEALARGVREGKLVLARFEFDGLHFSLSFMRDDDEKIPEQLGEKKSGGLKKISAVEKI